jgi:hypothetical protein
MQTAHFMNRQHPFRFSAALEMLRREGWSSLRVAPAGRGIETFVGVDVGGFTTALRPHEVDDIAKTAAKSDKLYGTMPLQARQFIDALVACADHIRETEEAAKKRMI